jgi:hypothetical protein
VSITGHLGEVLSGPRCLGIAALLITWTTGARKEATTGPIGITRCGNTWARTSEEPTDRQRVECVLSRPPTKCGISDIRYEDGPSLKKILQRNL